MGIYAVTGGSSGIGAKTVELLKTQGHTVYNIDIRDADIEGNLASEEGRQNPLTSCTSCVQTGWSGLICCAGVSDSCGNLKHSFSKLFRRYPAGRRLLRLAPKEKRLLCDGMLQYHFSRRNARMDIVALLNKKETSSVFSLWWRTTMLPPWVIRYTSPPNML